MKLAPTWAAADVVAGKPLKGSVIVREDDDEGIVIACLRFAFEAVPGAMVEMLRGIVVNLPDAVAAFEREYKEAL